MAAEVHYVYRGGGQEVIPDDATHVSIHKSVRVIPRRLFYKHQNIIELICHEGVIKIEREAFYECPRLKRVIMLGVKVVEECAFMDCEALTELECLKLERVGDRAFAFCNSLETINLPSAKIFEHAAFTSCEALLDVKFGKDLESITFCAFHNCPSLERITIPLKKGFLEQHDIFQGCYKLEHVDLIEREELREFVDALLLEEWRNDMNKEIDSINQILPNAYPGHPDQDRAVGDIAEWTWQWIESVLSKIIHYKALHRQLLNEVVSTLEPPHLGMGPGDEHELLTELINKGAEFGSESFRNYIMGRIWNKDGYFADLCLRCIPMEEARVIFADLELFQLAKVVKERIEKAIARSLPVDILMKNVVPYLELPPHTFDGEVEED